MRITPQDMQAMIITEEDWAAMQSDHIDLVRAANGRPGRVQRIARALLEGRFEDAEALSFRRKYPRKRPPTDDDDLA